MQRGRSDVRGWHSSRLPPAAPPASGTTTHFPRTAGRPRPAPAADAGAGVRCRRVAAPDDQMPDQPSPPDQTNGYAPHERTLAPSPFPGDDGAAEPAVRAALARSRRPRAGRLPAGGRGPLRRPAAGAGRRDGDAGRHHRRRAGLRQGGRHVGGHAAGGRRAAALLGFTGLDALQAWGARARPVPVTLDVAETAPAEGAVAVLVDVAGPHPLVIDGEVLDALALGHRLVELGDGFGWAVPAAGDDAGIAGPAR